MPPKIQLKRYRSLFASFDQYPSSKGAATHITHSATSLFETFGGPSLLFSLGSDEYPPFSEQPRYDHLALPLPGRKFIERTSTYSRELEDVIEELGDCLRCVQFRDPWSGVPILRKETRRFATVFEVNGLPSLELPVRYPSVRPTILAQ
ncbi:MAG: glycosyltransferase family 1 protein, partial [Verrucomicrobiota bacterium]